MNLIDIREVVKLADKIIHENAERVTEFGTIKTALAFLHNAMTLLVFEGVSPKKINLLCEVMSLQISESFEEFKQEKEKEGEEKDSAISKEVIDIINKAKEQQ